MKELPDLRALIKKRLSGAKKTSFVASEGTTSTGPSLPEVPPAPIADPVDIESSKEDLAQGSADREIANPSVSKSKKKRSAPSSSTSIEAHTEPPKKKRKKKEKRKKKPVEERSEPSEGVDGRELVVHGNSSREAAAQTGVELDDSPTVPLVRKRKDSEGQDAPASDEKSTPAAPPMIGSSGLVPEERQIKFPDHVEFEYGGDTPLAYAPTECAKLIRQMRGGPGDMPSVDDLFFKDAYVDAARTKVLVSNFFP